MDNFGFFGQNSYGVDSQPIAMESCAPEFGGHAVTAMESLMMNTEIQIAMASMENVVSGIQYEVSNNGLSLESALSLHGVTLESAAGNVGAKVKKAIQKLWGMVKSFFSAIRRTFDGMIMSTKDFANKYKKDLETLKLSGMKYKAYNYTNLDGAIDDVYSSSKMTGLKQIGHSTQSEDFDETEKEKGKEALDAYRGSLVGKGDVESEDFSKEVFSYFRGGAESQTDKKEIDVNIHSVLNSVKSNEKYSKDLSSGETKMNKFFKEQLDEITKLEGAANKDAANSSGDDAKNATSKAAALSKRHSRISAANSVAQTFVNGWRTAVVEQDKTNKAILIKAFSYKKKED